MHSNKCSLRHLLALSAALMVTGVVHAESPPPDQTYDDGGGGSVDAGAGNGGSGQNPHGGKSTSIPSCFVMDQPSWFPSTPPISEDVYFLDTNVVLHLVHYEGEFHHFFLSVGDDLSPIPGSMETWRDGKNQIDVNCLD